MPPNDHAILYARWEVIWFHKSRKLRKDFGTEYADAEELYLKVKAAGRKGATLRCKNVGFGPPKKLRPRQIHKRMRSKRTGKKVIVTSTVFPLKALNNRGIFWCPYCRKLRKFVKRKGAYVRSGRKPIWVEDEHWGCPVCDITHRDHHVRRHNPMAGVIDAHLSHRRTRRPRSGRSRRRRNGS